MFCNEVASGERVLQAVVRSMEKMARIIMKILLINHLEHHQIRCNAVSSLRVTMKERKKARTLIRAN